MVQLPSGCETTESQVRGARLVQLSPGQGGGGFMKKQQAEAWSLVLLSVNITHRLIQSHYGWEILVDELDAVAARRHLADYEAENSQWPPSVRALSSTSQLGFSKWTVVFCGLLVGLFMITGPWSHTVWFERGSIDSGAIKEHWQWWRLVTALTLHADIGHLVGNICLGGAVVSLLATITGPGVAWVLTFASGVAGNLVNVVLHGGNHHSLGFSTAVFGAIGALCGIRALRAGVVTVLLPLGAGLGLLAMLGAEGERTDLGAHIWGLASGMGLGGAYCYLEPLQKRIEDWRYQNIGAVGVMLVVVLAWGVALLG